MKTDTNGCSKTASGEEQYEIFDTSNSFGLRSKGSMVQYDYRTPDGKLFTTVASTLELCRKKRDTWLDEMKPVIAEYHPELVITADMQFSVPKKHFEYIMHNWAGAVAGRIDGDKFYLKVWMMKYLSKIRTILNMPAEHISVN